MCATWHWLTPRVTSLDATSAGTARRRDSRAMFGGDAGFGGGGASQFQGGGGFVMSQGNGDTPGKGQRKGNQTLTPVTAKMLNDAIQAGGDDLVIGGAQVTNISVNGKVLSAEAKQSAVEYVLDDGTGKIPVKHWNSEDAGDAMMPVGTYATAYGKWNNNEMTAYSMKPVTDFNEVTYHLMNVCMVDTYQKKEAGQYGNGGAENVKPVTNGAWNGAPAAAAPVGGNLGGGGGHNDCQAKLAALFEADQSDTGLTVDSVAAQLKEYNRTQIREAIDAMMNDGALYSTVDDNHWKSTAAM